MNQTFKYIYLVAPTSTEQQWGATGYITDQLSPNFTMQIEEDPTIVIRAGASVMQVQLSRLVEMFKINHEWFNS